MRSFFCLAHLLTFDKPFADHLIDCGFHKTRGYLFSVPIAITIIGDERVVGLDVASEILHCLDEFREVRTGLQPFQLLLQRVQFLQGFVDIAMP